MLTILNVLVKRILLVAMLVTVMILDACEHSDKNSSLIFEELNESLEKSNQVMENSTEEALNNLKSKLPIPVIGERTAIWLSKAESIYVHSNLLISFIDTLKVKLNTQNGLIDKQATKSLYNKLAGYRNYILNSDQEIRRVFEKRIVLFNQDFQNNYKDDEQFYIVNFKVVDSSKTKSFLQKLENDVRSATNDIIWFCNNQTTAMDCMRYTHVQPIAAINSMKFAVGDEMSVTVGIGEFTSNNKPEFFINGIKIAPNENGVGEYKMKIKNRPGNYKAHVKIKYTAPDGRQEVLEKDIEYTVVE